MTTHTSNVSVPGWSGAGYIVIDPKSGDGAYIISGGSNGGFAQLIDDIGIIINSTLLFVNIFTPQKYAFYFALIATIISLVTIWAMYTILSATGCRQAQAKYASVVLTAVALGTIIVSAIAGKGKGPATFIAGAMLIYGQLLQSSASAILKLKCSP